MALEEDISLLQERFHCQLQQAHSSAAVERLRVAYLGKKGPLRALLAQINTFPASERRQKGQSINRLKAEIETTCRHFLHQYGQQELAARVGSEAVDVTLPGRRGFIGRRHPLQRVVDAVITACREMSFSLQEGPEVESDWYNYAGLNFATDHPAREMQDTLYLGRDLLLRSHTSNVQLRVMKRHAPPLRVVSAGTVYRNERVSARTHVFFTQVEGFYIDRQVSFADLLATLRKLGERIFAPQRVQLRFRPSYFPFVAPAIEMDVSCLLCQQQGCALCKRGGWVEVAGAGLIHPQVLENGGIDAEEYSGFAWGMGIERLAMLKYRIPDIRLFSQNDIRFLAQFP